MVKIITDTTSCLSSEKARLYQIPVIPQVIHFGEETFLEGVNMDSASFMARLRSSKELPKTAAPPPELFTKEFERLVPLGEPILCIHPSSDLSGTVRSATVAAQDFPGADIRVLDTRLIASPLGTLVEQAAKWAAEGIEADTIVARLNDLSARCRIYFLVDTLEFLARGGRIGHASALLGSVLQIKPILALKDGKIEAHEKERTHRRAVNRLKEIVLEQAAKNHTAMVTVMEASVPEIAKTLAQEIGSELNQTEVPISHMPPAIITHAGPGLLAVGFFA